MNKITEKAIVKGCLLEVAMHDNDNTTLEIWVNNGYYHFRNNSKTSNCSTCYKSFEECKNSFEYSYNYMINHVDIYGACKPEITHDKRSSNQKGFELDKIHSQQQLEELEEVETITHIVRDTINNQIVAISEMKNSDYNFKVHMYDRILSDFKIYNVFHLTQQQQIFLGICKKKGYSVNYGDETYYSM